MRIQSRFSILVWLLAFTTGCSPDEVRVEGEVDAEGSEGSEGSDDGADPTTDDTDDGETTVGSEDGTDDGADPPWGPELDGDEIVVEPVPVQRPTQGSWPVAVFGGEAYLAAWEDHRRRRPVLYGGRVAADGTALDPLGFPILDSPAPGPDDDELGQYQPAVASDGVNFLIATRSDNQLLGVRVSATGEVLDPGGFVIAELAYPGVVPSLVFDGEQYVVAWWDHSIYRARVQPDGTVLDPDGVLVESFNDRTGVGLSSDGTNTMLSWEDDDDQLESAVLMGSRMASDGTQIDQVPFLITPIEDNWFIHLAQPVAGFDGTNHVVAWVETSATDGGSEEYHILATRVTPDGTALDPGGILVFTEGFETTDMHRLEVAAGSGRSHVVWSRDQFGGGPAASFVRVARIETDGTTSVYPHDTFARGLEAAAAVHPDGAMLLWRDGFGLGDDYGAITGTLLDGADVPVPNSVLAPASTASRQDVRAVASDGQNYFVLWMDTRDPLAHGKALYGARVGPFGEALDPEPILICGHDTHLADVVFDGVNYVVTWVSFSDPFNTVRVSPAGELLDIGPHKPGLRARGSILAGASDGTHTLLIGAEDHYDPNVHIELAAVLLNHDGELASDLIPILVNSYSANLQASVSFDGLGYLVVWRDKNEVGIFGQKLTQAGELEGEILPIVDHEVQHVASAAGGGQHLVVWEQDSGIWATRVSPDGQVLDPGGILIAASEVGVSMCEWEPELLTGACASVAFDGENFIVAWRAPSMLGDWSSLDLYAVQVSPDGEVSSQLELSQGPEREGAPVLAAGDGRVLAAYSQFVPGSPYDTRRAMARLLTP
jgi:hypothetical protein